MSSHAGGRIRAPGSVLSWPVAEFRVQTPSPAIIIFDQFEFVLFSLMGLGFRATAAAGLAGLQL